MKKLLLLCALLISFLSQIYSQSSVVYEGRYGYNAIVHIDNDVIYEGRYGYDAIFHIKDNVIYKGRYGYDAVAHFKDGVLYRGRYGYDAILHIDGQTTTLQLLVITLISDWVPIIPTSQTVVLTK